MELILASASPRRREILAAAGIGCRVVTSGIEESPLPGEAPEMYARRLALEKAEAVARQEPGLILAADTIVVLGESILEKPADPEDAGRMLAMLAGHSHQVITGIAIVHPGGVVVDAERTWVRFSPLASDEIRDYVATGEPLGKAGAYAIQGRASRFVASIEGCYFNVVGLPLSRVYRHLRDLGWSG